jgi:hypothetical protein
VKTARSLIVLSILLLSIAISASAQRPRKPAPKPTPKPTSAAVNPVVSAAKLQVSNQLYNVNVFVDKLGPIAVAIEGVDKDAAGGRLKKEAVDANELNKKRLVAAIRGLREGLVTLETDFRTKPQLSPYLARIQGITNFGAQAEDSAIAGQFVAAKDPLRQVALKLNETLAVLPGALPAGSTSYSAPPMRTTTIPVSTQNSQTSTSVQNVSTAKRDVAVGMTTAEVLQSTWGAPSNKRTSKSSNGTTEVWLYSGNRSVYFFNGKVTQVVK